jgi:hypothetical protein
MLLTAFLAHAEDLAHTQHHVLHVHDVRMASRMRKVRLVVDLVWSSCPRVAAMVAQDELLNVSLLAEQLLPRQTRCDYIRYVGREAGQLAAGGPRHRLRDPLSGVVLEAEVISCQLLLGLLGGQGQLLAVQLVHVAPERAGLGGRGGPTLPVEVLVVL